jgi:phenylalanyl-tRNA synthetase beta chain
MRIPLRWLSDYVELPDSPAHLAERLTLAGLEVSGVRLLGVPVPVGLRVKEEELGPVWDRDKIVIAEIKEVKPHPDADKLKLPIVAYGAAESKQLVTGAGNIAIGDRGQKVVLALAGAALYDGHSEEKVIKKLKLTKIRGVPSDAMVCSYYELGVNEEHEGIIILEDDAPVGMPLVDFMGDVVLEVDVLPNMARCLSMIGVAREVAALTDKTLKYPPKGMTASGASIEGQVRVEIEDSKLSARYAAVLLKDVQIGQAPGWMQRRLMYAGMRSINNIVDITNYIMLEWGQPLHAFDYDLLVQRAGAKAPTIIVRPARAGEKIVTLDGVERSLTSDDLIIADTAGPIAIAGVMGGRDTEVSLTTKNILLESANFDFISVRRTMRRLDLPSEASLRFSRGIHPETVRPAAERAAELMRQHAGAKICQGLIDNYPARPQPQVIRLRFAEIKRVLGIEIPAAEVTRILQALEFQVELNGAETLRVTTPAHRLDIQEGEADLLEELARIHGYDRLPETLLADQLPRQHTNRSLLFEETVRDMLAGAGLQEIKSYALTAPEREAAIGETSSDYVRLLNPISRERVVMRQSLLASVLEVAANNLKNMEDVRLFEIGAVYLPRSGQTLPEEPRRLALLLTGKHRPEFWTDSSGTELKPQPLDFFDIKGVVEALLGDLHVRGVSYRRASTEYLRPGKAANVCSEDKLLGSFGQLHPRVAERCGMDAQRIVLVGEFDVEVLQAAMPDRYTYKPVPRFPAALRDIAVVVDNAKTAEEVESEIRAGGGKLLREVRLFDVYAGGSIPTGRKSLAYALTYQADDRTLTDKEVDKAHQKIEERLKRVLQAQIRGEE